MIKLIKSAFSSIKSLLPLTNSIFTKNHCSSCIPLCAHCEVEISEKTALAISKLIEKRINNLPKDHSSAVLDELNIQKELILNGDWHEYYDSLTEKEENNGTII